MKSALIFLHGDLSDTSQIANYAKTADLIIAADGGAQYAHKLKIVPDIIIGDLDSIAPDIKTLFEEKNVTFEVYPREKNFTDAELAISYALKHNATTIIIAGYFGRRFDHMMANLLHLSTIPADISIIEGNERFFFIKKLTQLRGNKNDELSLIPLTPECSGISTIGLTYPLRDEALPLGSTRGISNVFEAKTAQVDIKKGTLLAVHRASSPISIWNSRT